MIPSHNITSHSLALLKSLFDDSPNAIGIIDANGAFLEVNPKMSDLFGYEKSEFSMLSIRDVLVEDDQYTFDFIARRLHDVGEKRMSFSCVFQNKSGVRFRPNTFISSITENIGDPQRFLITITGFSEAHPLELALSKKDDQYRRIYMDSPVGILIVNISDRKIINANDKFLSMTGFSRKEILGKSTSDFTYFEDKEEKKVFTKELLARERTSFTTFKQFKHKEGRGLWCKVTRSLIKFDNIPCMIGFIEDISIQKEAEKSNNESRFLNKNITEIIPEFIGIIDFENRKLMYSNFGDEYFGLT